MITKIKLHNKIFKIDTQIIIIAILLSVLFHVNYFAAEKNNRSFHDGVVYLSNIIIDERYPDSLYSDLQIVDSLYSNALEFYDGDISEALLALTFATLPFNRMPVTLPIINKVYLKLPSINEEFFPLKRKNTPGLILFDSSESRGEDRDKLAHFFGNAFLAYNISYFNLSKFLGLMVELFESAFKVSGGVDYRDLQANHLGEFFGYSCRNHQNLKVSEFLNVYSLFYFSYN